MAHRFVAADAQRLYKEILQVPVVPFTVGVWCRPSSTAAGVRTVVSFSDTATATNHWSLVQNGSTAFRIDAQAGGTLNSGSAGVPVANRWFFLIGRFISATNRRLAVLSETVGASHIQATTSRAPGSVDHMAIGDLDASTQTQFFDGDIGEYWITNTDIQPDAAQLQDSMLRTLAFRGPFAVPRIRRDIVSYRSLKLQANNGSGAGLVGESQLYPLTPGRHDNLRFTRLGMNWTGNRSNSTAPHVKRLNGTYSARPMYGKSMLLMA